MKLKMPREFYIPKKSVKVTDKLSDAVAYVYDSANPAGGKTPYAAIFFGKQAKPYTHYRYRTAERREASIKLAFESRRKSLAFKAEQRAKRLAWVPNYKVGEILHTSWGYDQTNVEFFEIVEAKGKFVTLRELAQETVHTGIDSGKCVPLPGQYLKPRYEGDDAGVPIRRLAQEHGVKIDDVRTAFRTRTEKVGTIEVVKPQYFSWGH
jgi:hypothetical protein